MKIIYLNDAIVSYVEFLQRVLTANEKSVEENSVKEFTEFLDCYKQLTQDEDVVWNVNDITNDLKRFPVYRVKMYYSNENKVLVFVQLLIEKRCSNSDLHLLTSLSNEDLEKIQSALHDFWYSDNDFEHCQHIYLDKDEVTWEVLRKDMIESLDRTKEIFQEINNIQTKAEKEA